MNADFSDRARRFEEQIEVLRAFWTRDIVNFTGDYHRLEHVNIRPRPARSIPIWFGSGNLDKPIPSDRILRRVGRLADGWLPLFLLDHTCKPNPVAVEAISRVNGYTRAAGRIMDRMPLELCVVLEDKSDIRVADEIRVLRAMGATDRIRTCDLVCLKVVVVVR